MGRPRWWDSILRTDLRGAIVSFGITSKDAVRCRALIFLMAWILSACSGSGVSATRAGCGTCDEADRFVRLQAATGTGTLEAAPPFTHPFYLSPEEWKPILESIQIRRRGQGPLFFLAANKPTQQAFSPREIQFLCERLPRAFAEAQPSDVVVFGIMSTGKSEITDLTTGAWYVKGATLYLLLSNYREGVTMPNIRELVLQQPLRMIAAPLYDFVPGPHQAISSASDSLTSFLIPQAPQLALAYQPIGAQSPAIDHPKKAGMPVSRPADQSLEDKLRRLQHLHQEGLITDEDYATKKQALLEGL